MARRVGWGREKRDGVSAVAGGYDDVLTGVVDVLESARRTSTRAVNALMAAAYWEIGRRIVEFEQGGAERGESGACGPRIHEPRVIGADAREIARSTRQNVIVQGFGGTHAQSGRGWAIGYCGRC